MCRVGEQFGKFGLRSGQVPRHPCRVGTELLADFLFGALLQTPNAAHQHHLVGLVELVGEPPGGRGRADAWGGRRLLVAGDGVLGRGNQRQDRSVADWAPRLQ